MAETEGILQTPNIGLYKPDYANIADIQVLNENFDKLDTTIKQAGDDLTAHNIATDAHENRFNQYLSLTGGTMKGDIVFTEGKDIYNSADNGMTVSSNPANAEKSSKLVLYPKSTGGAFSIHCGDGTNEGILTAYPTGELYWNGSDIKNPIKNASISGKVITLTFADGTTKTLTTQDTTYSSATTSKAGLMTASDKTKLNSLRSGGAVCYGTCTTAKATNAKVATITQGSFSLQAGQIVAITFSNDLTNSGYQTGDGYITLNVNSSGAKKIRTQAGNKTTVTNYLTNWCYLYKGSHVFCYDGTDWLMLNNAYIGYTDWNNAGT